MLSLSCRPWPLMCGIPFAWCVSFVQIASIYFLIYHFFIPPTYLTNKMRIPLSEKQPSNMSMHKQRTGEKKYADGVAAENMPVGNISADVSAKNIGGRSQDRLSEKSNSTPTDKERVITFLNTVTATTTDYSLKYDLIKCVQMIQGKENMEYVEMKEALLEALEENERLENDRAKLMCENEWLRGKVDECGK